MTAPGILFSLTDLRTGLLFINFSFSNANSIQCKEEIRASQGLPLQDSTPWRNCSLARKLLLAEKQTCFKFLVSM